MVNREQLKQRFIEEIQIIQTTVKQTMIEQVISTRILSISLLAVCIQKCKEIGDKTRMKYFYDEVVKMNQEIEQLYDEENTLLKGMAGYDE